MLRDDIDSLDERHVYEEIDLPLVPILLRMETVGVRIDSVVLNLMGEKLSSEMQRVRKDIREGGGIASTSIHRNSWVMCSSTR